VSYIGPAPNFFTRDICILRIHLSLAGLCPTIRSNTGRTPATGVKTWFPQPLPAVELGHLQELASRLLRHAPDAGCHPGACRILVTNFLFPDGSAFPYGIQWADELSSYFAAQEKAIQVVNRSLVKNLLQKDQISGMLQNSEPAARWLGKQFEATVVLVGKARMIRGTIVELSARFLNVNDVNLIGPSSEVSLEVTSSTAANLLSTAMADFSSLTGLPPPLPPFPDTVNGEKIYRMGEGGVGVPSCYYMPTPRMTYDAASAGFSGIIVAEVVVGMDGAVRDVRIVKGAPFGLSDEVVKAVKTWQCKPAELDGKPVAVVAKFETNFRSSPSG
jgi:hypothetical protein